MFWEAFDIPDVSLNLIVVIAAITIVISALLAFVQNDIKKVLAYSTVGQLGYMMLGLGAGAWLPAVFHIFTHAFFKCGLFLCAGSVSHSGSHHSFDMKRDMGGLAKKMPITATCWIIASLALAGVFPLAGFFSKDEIIDNVGHNGYEVFMWIALGGAFLTAAYTVRATYLTFFGEPRGAAAGHGHDALGDELSSHDLAHDVQQEGELEHEEHEDHGVTVAVDHHAAHAEPHESPRLILIPICILAFLSIVAGLTNAVAFGEEWEKFGEYVEPHGEPVSDEAALAAEEGEAAPPAEGEAAAAEEGAAAHEEITEGCGYTTPEAGTACFFPADQPCRVQVVEGRALARRRGRRPGVELVRLRRPVHPSRPAPRGAHGPLAPGPCRLPVPRQQVLPRRLYEGVIVRAIAHPIANAAYWTNQNVIDAIVNAAGWAGKWAGRWFYRNVDQRVVDGAVNGSGAVANGTGSALQPVQSGKVNQYGALLFGAAAIAAVVLVLVNV